MKTAWIIVNKSDGKPKINRVTGIKMATVFLSKRAAKIFLDDHERVQRVRVTIY